VPRIRGHRVASTRSPRREYEVTASRVRSHRVARKRSPCREYEVIVSRVRPHRVGSTTSPVARGTAPVASIGILCGWRPVANEERESLQRSKWGILAVELRMTCKRESIGPQGALHRPQWRGAARQGRTRCLESTLPRNETRAAPQDKSGVPDGCRCVAPTMRASGSRRHETRGVQKAKGTARNDQRAARKHERTAPQHRTATLTQRTTKTRNAPQVVRYCTAKCGGW
jgi:hypothetical protein